MVEELGAVTADCGGGCGEEVRWLYQRLRIEEKTKSWRRKTEKGSHKREERREKAHTDFYLIPKKKNWPKIRPLQFWAQGAGLIGLATGLAMSLEIGCLDKDYELWGDGSWWWRRCGGCFEVHGATGGRGWLHGSLSICLWKRAKKKKKKILFADG